MATIAEPQLRYDPFSHAAMSDPQRFYPALRDHHPAYFIPEYDTWVFSRFEDVWNGFMDRDHFSESEMMLFSPEQLRTHHRPNPRAPSIDPVKASFLFLDPPVHTRFRQALAGPFLKGNVARREAEITQIARARLRELLERGTFDLNGDFASFVSVVMVCRVLGLGLEDPIAIAEAVNRLIARDPLPDAPPIDQAAQTVRTFLHAAIARRRRDEGPPSPAIDALIARDTIGRALTDDEIASDLNGILVGGTETLPKILAGGLLELSQRPDQLAQIRAAMPGSIAPAFEEMLRFNAPAQWFGRTVRQPVSLGGVDLEPGQRVILLLASANRDPREFDDPDAFVWNRKPRRLISFGVGPHFCIGIHLARLEGQIMLREFLSAVQSFTVHPERGHWPVSEFQIGWTSLPVTVNKTT